MAINIEDVMNRVMDMVEKKQKDMPSGLQMYNDAQTKAKWDAIDKANAARDSLSSQEKQSESKLTTEQYKTALKNQQDLYTANAKNQNAIDVARIRAGDDGTGTGSSLGGGGRRGNTAHQQTQAAIEWAKANPGLPGKPGMSIDQARKELYPPAPRAVDANGMVVKTPAASTEGMSGYGGPDETPAQRAERQALVPGHKNASMGISTPYGEAPNALSPNQWQQYADSKSPGMKYNGNQPGMINDQIAGFTKPDGTRFFANTGAARTQAGTAGITPEAVATPVTPSTAQAFTTGGSPDAANRIAINTVKAIPLKPATRFAQDIQDLKTSLNYAPSTAPDSIYDPEREGAASLKSPLRFFNSAPTSAPAPTPASGPKQGLMSRAISALGPDPQGTNIFNDPAADTSWARLRAANTRLENLMPGPKPKGFLDWWKDTSRRNMPKQVPKTKSWFDIPESSTNPLFPNYKQ